MIKIEFITGKEDTMINDLAEELKQFKLQDQINYFAKKYKNKKVIIYPAGMYYDTVAKNFDLSELNIIGLSDIKFTQETVTHEGLPAIPPAEIAKHKPDVVIICAQNQSIIENYFENDLIPKYGKFKYSHILDISIWECIKKLLT